MFIMDVLPALKVTQIVAIFSGISTVIFVTLFILWSVRGNKNKKN